jgi:hydrogenase nickel incorporation protein HypA/HybF
MHEMSIAMNIVEIAEERARVERAKRVVEMELEVGELAGVVYDALDFALASAVKNTMLEYARILVGKVPGLAQCQQCQHEYPTGDYFSACPVCGSFMTEITRGRELRVKSITVE